MWTSSVAVAQTRAADQSHQRNNRATTRRRLPLWLLSVGRQVRVHTARGQFWPLEFSNPPPRSSVHA